MDEFTMDLLDKEIKFSQVIICVFIILVDHN